MAIHTAVGL